MQTRQIIAYILIVLLVAGLSAAWLFVTRDRRADRRASRERRHMDRQRATKNADVSC